MIVLFFTIWFHKQKCLAVFRSSERKGCFTDFQNYREVDNEELALGQEFFQLLVVEKTGWYYAIIFFGNQGFG